MNSSDLDLWETKEERSFLLRVRSLSLSLSLSRSLALARSLVKGNIIFLMLRKAKEINFDNVYVFSKQQDVVASTGTGSRSRMSYNSY